MDTPQKAFLYITNLVKELIPEANIAPSRGLGPDLKYYFWIEFKNKDYPIIFNLHLLKDFEDAIDKHYNSSYHYDLESQVNFIIYMALGKEGLLPNIRLSKEFLNEKREWRPHVDISLNKKIEIYKIFYEGLRKLSSFLKNTMKQYGGLSGTIAKELQHIENLIKYYDDKQHFTDTGVSNATLGYLKSAALCVILNKEKEKEAITIPRVRKDREQEIYFIAGELREPPFDTTKLPDCIYDYAEHFQSNQKELKSIKEELVFIACGQSTEREKAIGIKIKNIFTQKGIHSFFAEKANDLQSLNSHIFNNLDNCTRFIAVLHKRQENKYETSVWINQEVGIVAFLRSTEREIPSLILYEDGLEPEGLIKYTIANPLKFKSDEEIVKKIEQWLNETS